MKKEVLPLKERSSRAIVRTRNKVIEAYEAGLDDEEACMWGQITMEELDELTKKNEQVRTARENGKNPLNLMARVNVANDIKDGNVRTSKWLLERTDEDYSNRQKVSMDGTPIVVPMAEKEKAMEEILKKYTVTGDFTEDE